MRRCLSNFFSSEAVSLPPYCLVPGCWKFEPMGWPMRGLALFPVGRMRIVSASKRVCFCCAGRFHVESRSA